MLVGGRVEEHEVGVRPARVAGVVGAAIDERRESQPRPGGARAGARARRGARGTARRSISSWLSISENWLQRIGDAA
jgi:hypothetical protein